LRGHRFPLASLPSGSKVSDAHDNGHQTLPL
jgi:hypothetical protein